jgi:hypothetical protein
LYIDFCDIQMNWIDYTAEEIERLDTYNYSLTHGIECSDCGIPLTPLEVKICEDLHLEYACSDCLELELVS